MTRAIGVAVRLTNVIIRAQVNGDELNTRARVLARQSTTRTSNDRRTRETNARYTRAGRVTRRTSTTPRAKDGESQRRESTDAGSEAR